MLSCEDEDRIRDIFCEMFNYEVLPRMTEMLNRYDRRPRPKYEINQSVWAGCGVQSMVIIANRYYNYEAQEWVYQFYGPDSFGEGWYDYFTEEHLADKQPE